MVFTKEEIRKMIQNRVAFLIKESQPVTVQPEEYKTLKTRIGELDWVLTLFGDK